MGAPADMPNMLAERATGAAHAVGYEFADATKAVTTLTYGELHHRARGLAQGILRRQDRARDPVVILYPPGLDYVTAVYACFLAGTPAVPAYPPDPGRPGVSRDRLTRILSDLGSPMVLADETIAAEAGRYGADRARVLTGRAAFPGDMALPAPTADDIALIQYTSGSSSAPKGVIVRHGNLTHNIAAIVRSMHVGAASRAMMWLPPYHDMGLIGGILTPMFAGFPVRLMAPFDFLKRPLAWLRHISDFGATVSGGPNFAYDLCVRRLAREGAQAWLAGTDLSRWRVAFNGAEPVRADTMAAFARTFAPAGFDRAAFFPCYGLAEATLLVSGGHWEDGPPGPADRVSCGPPLPDQVVIVVDRDTQERLPDGAEGEIMGVGTERDRRLLGRKRSR
jgi:acyl-CoA synthetase (AMP-forming)/AMP-acid ligase II